MRADLEEYGGVRRKKILLPKDFPVENDKVCQEVHKSVERKSVVDYFNQY